MKRGLRRESVDHIEVDPGEPDHPLRAEPLDVGGIADRADPAPHRGQRPVELGGDPPVPDPAGAGQQRRPDDRGRVGPARRGRGGQQHVGDPAGAAAGPPRPQRQRGVARGRARCGCGRDPTGAAGGCIPGRPGCRRPGRSRPERGRRSRSSRHGGGTAHEHGLPAPPVGGVSWCGSRSGPSAGRAGRVDTGRARHVDDAPRPPCCARAGRSGFVVMVAAPTNPLGHRASVVTVNGGNRPPDRHPGWRSIHRRTSYP